MDAAGTQTELLARAVREVRRVIVGQEYIVERLVVALLARGHCLLEGVPGVAKTLAVHTLADVVGGSFVRIQFTPDLVPSDLLGTRIYHPSREEFDVELGPVFANFVLADEINRAPAKVQSALLEVMSERQVSLAGTTYALPKPFIVIATQNPIESEGVYALPEAQRDRFLAKLLVPYPGDDDEFAILRRMSVDPPSAEPVLDAESLLGLQRLAGDVPVDDGVAQYAVGLVMATRDPARFGLAHLVPLIEIGASPRGTLGLVAAARALALLRRRRYVVPDEIRDVARDVLGHRIVLSFDALADGVDPTWVVDQVLAAVPAPVPVPAPLPANALRREATA